MQGKKCLVFSLVAMAAVVGAGTAYAAERDDQGQMHTISWEDFKSRCTDSKDKPLNEQGRPQHIRVQCTNVEREFVPMEPGTIPLEATRHVITTVLSDKFDVSAMSKDFAFPGSAGKGFGACLRFREVERTIQIEKTLSCGELLGIKGEINDYCAGALEMVKGTSPKLIETHETGVVRDTCGNWDSARK